MGRKTTKLAALRLGAVAGNERAAIFTALLDLNPWPAAILLDFSAVDYINSAGIAQLINLLRHARTRGGVLRARGLSEHYRKIFRMGVDGVH
ncbi:STAS domain-containing protein [Moorella sp. Hama-1]|uniref:STAS domain-containing protein n=1 Tax=Moorella sp. Hama-1 TaxID=2138101 RepID=UPI000D64D6E0|nr:STAS domain-containing protein [Moorella sp. Hama-1]BCV22092.1 hypothetical protein hamaS1_21610 [Moorella sp. Hama-1]